MLVLSRRLNEKLLIPGIRTAIQVLSIQGSQVRLGVDAPSDVAILREEIYQRGPNGDAPLDRPSAPVKPACVRRSRRNRLATLALGLNRVQRRLKGTLAPDAQTAADNLADELHGLTRIVQALLEDDDAPPARRPADCAG